MRCRRNWRTAERALAGPRKLFGTSSQHFWSILVLWSLARGMRHEEPRVILDTLRYPLVVIFYRRLRRSGDAMTIETSLFSREHLHSSKLVQLLSLSSRRWGFSHFGFEERGDVMRVTPVTPVGGIEKGIEFWRREWWWSETSQASSHQRRPPFSSLSTTTTTHLSRAGLGTPKQTPPLPMYANEHPEYQVTLVARAKSDFILNQRLPSPGRLAAKRVFSGDQSGRTAMVCIHAIVGDGGWRDGWMDGWMWLS
ncbi:hypothetical protein QBC35DRAFT_118212 [Podospora australis]|uniref:Uncharacterized protein n=1 Tax=Podospora australis TaxID=1536484 RepID=A0AAN7ALN4_9PEZI|nr:hypothetical protein QBC35DRAFT_118212 [Podospora australis]